MASRAGLDGCGISHPTGIRSLVCPARSEPLYRLRHPGLPICICTSVLDFITFRLLISELFLNVSFSGYFLGHVAGL